MFSSADTAPDFSPVGNGPTVPTVAPAGGGVPSAPELLEMTATTGDTVVSPDVELSNIPGVTEEDGAPGLAPEEPHIGQVISDVADGVRDITEGVLTLVENEGDEGDGDYDFDGDGDCDCDCDCGDGCSIA